jgi:methionyl aminopeptidase
VAIRTFISTHSTLAVSLEDGWTLAGNKEDNVAQHEHTIVATEKKSFILTEANSIFA